MEQCRRFFLEVPGKGHFFAEPLAKTGAKDRVQLYGEVGLQYGNEARPREDHEPEGMSHGLHRFDEPPTPDEPPADEVPDAAIPAVLAWVDGDPDRAVQALTFEQGKGERARSTLVADLTALIQQP
jgi:hypothetical protein